MDSYWKTFWKEHARSTNSEHMQYQVLRTLNKKPISENQFENIVKYIEHKMKICRKDKILELCCGNGLITKYLASKCKSVVGVDFTEELTAQIDRKKYQNISVIVEDIKKVDFKEQSFNKVIIYAGLQYLSYKETIYLFKTVMRWLKNGGLFFIGDIPNRARIWNFFNSRQREETYFDSIKNDKHIIGTWFDPKWLEKLGNYINFNNTEILQQPEDFPYSHYRFDMVLKK